MASSDVEICNLALGNLGHTAAIASLSDATKEAVLCNRYYAQTRDRLFELVDWNFARKRAALVENITSDTNTDWPYAYDLPADCIKPRAIIPERRLASSQKNKFRVGTTNAGTAKVLFADYPPIVDDLDAALEPVLIYTFRNTVVSTYPAYFVDALAWMLADALGVPIRVDPRLLGILPQRARYALDLAISSDYADHYEDPEPDASYIRIRE